MRSLLVALQEGRLVELASSDKVTSLEFLSNLIEAVPNVPSNTDVFRMVMEREILANTAIGHAIACPHARVRQERGSLLCTAGWSPVGIDYRAMDSVPVHLVCMYYVPSSERGAFLKEMSALSHAVEKDSNMMALLRASSLEEVRGQLLGWVAQALDASVPDTRAKMIQIARRAPVVVPQENEPTLRLVDVLVVEEEETSVFAITDDLELARGIESTPSLAFWLEKEGTVQWKKYRLITGEQKVLSTSRTLYKCVVIPT
jgi:nitrogen PTS system EIIA component